MLGDLGVIGQAGTQGHGGAFKRPQSGPGAAVTGDLLIVKAGQAQGKAFGQMLADEIFQVEFIAGGVVLSRNILLNR